MLCNSSVTIYHQNGLDVATHNELWERFNYNKAWVFASHSTSINKGLNDTNDVEVRIPYDENEGLNIKDFSVGDIIVKGTLDLNIESQLDLNNYNIYHITGITNNDFGRNQHIHLSGK